MPAVLHLVAYRGDVFFLWAETVAPPEGGARDTGRHPRGLPAQVLASRLPPGVGPTDAAPGEALLGDMLLPLPTAGHEPLPSPSLGGNPDAAGALRRWLVSGVAVPVRQMEPLLHPMPDIDPLLRPAPEWTIWWAAAAWVRSLVARGAISPALSMEPDGELVPRWRVAPGRADKNSLAALASALPPAGVVPTVAAEDALAGFADTYADLMVRRALTGREPRAALRRALRGVRGAPRSWVLALTAAWPEPLVAERRLGSATIRWMSDPAGLQGPPSLVLRLEEPGAAGADGGDAALDDEDPRGNPAAWALTIYLRPADEPTALIPADEVWRAGSGPSTPPALGGPEADAALAQGLRRAGAIFAPLRQALAARTGRIPLGAEQVWSFLAEAAQRLEARGIVVMAPDFLVEPPRVRLHMESASRDQGTLTAEALVRFSWEVALGGRTITPEEFERLVAHRQPLCRLGDRWVVVPPALAQRLRERWAQGPRGEVAAGAALLLALQTGADPDAPPRDAQGSSAEDGARAVELLADGPLQRALQGLGADPPEVDPPARFRGRLRPYQRRGLAWLAARARMGLGGVLADDMGLGKTVQILALVARRAAEGVKRPTLVVAPTSVVANWAAECTAFTPDLRVVTHLGTGRSRGTELASVCAGADMVVTSYPLLTRDADSLSAVQWDGVVMDEAQNIKNAATKQAHAARRMQGAYRFALTGTPVENALSDLWSIFAFVAPGYLGSARAFQQRLATPIERGRAPDAVRTLQRLVAPLVLRRTKQEPGVADELPPKIETLQRCHLTREQAALYEAVTRSLMERIEVSSGMARRAAVLLALLRLKQICNHPAHYADDGSALGGRSGKLARLEDLLEEVVAGGERALVFTQFAAFGRRLAEHLRARLAGCPVLYLDGGTPAAERAAVIQRFQSGLGGREETAGSDPPGNPCVFVLSLKAGGAGLNLTAARHVFHYDRWWNPAVEQQATDRAHRIGQVRVVQVHKLLCVGTLEERIDDLIRRKEALAAEIFGREGEGWITELDDTALRELFTLRRSALG